MIEKNSASASSLLETTNFNTLLMRTLAAFTGASVGILVFLGALFLGSSAMNASLLTTQIEGEMHPLFILLALLSVFLALSAANLAGGAMWMYTDQKRFPNFFSTLSQILGINIIVLLFFAPLYLAASGLNTAVLIVLTLFHILLTTSHTLLILEGIADHRYLIVTLYGLIMGAFVSLLINGWLYLIMPKLIIFAALPISWFWLASGVGLSQYLYTWIYRIFGTDFLNIETRYGQDYELKS